MIDTHQHLIHPDRFAYSWADDIPALQGPFRLQEYNKAAHPTAFEGSLFMEVDVDEAQSADEARFFCQLAEIPSNRILGVVAAARPEKDDFESYLDSIAHERLLGIRRVLHTQPDELSTGSLFRENIRALANRNLTFDLCVLQRQLPLAIELVQSAPEVSFVLDHCGVPDIASNNPPQGEGWLHWKSSIRCLAACPNVFGKISGITMYASVDQRNASALSGYVQTMIDAFGPDRLVWGGDWPVVNLGSGLTGWINMTAELLSHLTPGERENILSRNARTIYHIPS
jgi:predicted TIM-barrel fold metal-dependent hydrolase